MVFKKLILVILSIYSSSIFTMEQEDNFDTKQNAGIFSELSDEVIVTVISQMILQANNLKQFNDINSLRKSCQFMKSIFYDKDIKKLLKERIDLIKQQFQEVQNFLNRCFPKVSNNVFENIDFNKYGSFSSETALISVIKKERYDIATLLIYFGANLNLQDDWGTTALIAAIQNYKENKSQDCKNIIRLLIKNGADVNLERFCLDHECNGHEALEYANTLKIAR